MSPLIQQEALEVLTAELDGHTGRIPPSLAAAQLLRATEGGDFALQKAAADALLRRIRAVSDEWRLAHGRSGAHPRAGAHRVIVARGRSYQVWVGSFRELSGSCACADRTANSRPAPAGRSPCWRSCSEPERVPARFDRRLCSVRRPTLGD
jgi:hypothetical protein